MRNKRLSIHFNIKSFFSSSLKWRLSMMFLLFTFIPILIIGILLFEITAKYSQEVSYNSSAQLIDKAAHDLNSLMTDMSDIPEMITMDPQIQEVLRQTYTSQEQMVPDRIRGDARLSLINRYRSDIYGIYVLFDNGMTMKSRYYEFRYTDFVKNSLYQDIKNTDGITWFMPPSGSEIVITTGDKVLASGTQLNNLVSGNREGIVVVEVKQNFIKKLITLNLGHGGYIFIADDQDKPILSSIGVELNQIAEEYTHTPESEVDEQAAGMQEINSNIVIRRQITINGWHVIGVIPRSLLSAKSTFFAWIISATMVIFIILALYMARFYSRRELEPIDNMVKLMKKIETGDFTSKLEIYRDDEIGNVSRSFNSMIVKIEALIQEVDIKHKNLRKAEFKALQAQINPHFLYNTLDSINWLSRNGKNEQVSEMVSALTSFFKLALSKGRDFITIKEESSHVLNYLVIQKIRYYDQFDYKIYVDPASENHMVPKLILQPLVENALYHGVKPCNKKCLIMVNVMKNNGEIILEVIDNGIGMDQQKLASIQTALADGDDSQTTSYGLVNVSQRLKILTGMDSVLQLNSEVGRGTIVTIRIPESMEVGHYV